MVKVIIECSKVNGEEDFHQVFGELSFAPKHYGKNLNALWDVLTTDIEGPVEFIFQNHSHFSNANESEYKRIINIFTEASKERNSEIKVTLS